MLKKLVNVRIVLLLAAIFLASAILLNRAATVEVGAAGSASVIVEFREDPAAVYKAKAEKSGAKISDDQLQAYRSQLRAAQDGFLAELKSRGVSYTIDGVDVPDFTGAVAARADFRYTLVLNAIALQVPATALDTIKAMPQVKRVHPNTTLRINLEKSVDYINAPAAYGKYKELTATDDFREGYEGQGINIAVLDTGIDWTHEMFGGDPTPPRLGVAPPVAAANSNKKVIYYMTFTGGLLDDFGHGTAASSNAAGYLGFAPGADKLPGTGDEVRVHGVAPQARLMGYKVCLGVGSCLSTSTIMAIEDAVSPQTLTLQPKPVAHVINLSLGGAGSPDDATAVAASNAALLGTTVVASAGNEGPGENTVGSPAAGRHVIAVGANNDPASGSNTVDHIGGRTGMIANLLDGAAAITADITQNYVYCGLAETPDQVPDSVRGRIALIERGGTVNTPDGAPVSAGTGLFSNKAAFAFAKGAVAAIIYNNVDGELSSATVRASTIPVVGISKINGEYLKEKIGSTAVGAVSTTQIRLNKALLFNPQTTDFSSRGPVEGLGQVKPDVTAPGLGILSATVRVGSADANTATMFSPTGYIPASGTSFSGPHVAGAVALIKQAHLDFTPDMIRAVLTNTSTNLRNAAGTPRGDGDASESILAQGGGLVNVAAAINAKAVMGVEGDGIIEPAILASHSFGEMPILNNRISNTRSVTVTIRDTSGEGGTYSLSTVNNRFTDLDGATTSVSPSSVDVPAGGSVTFTATVTLDGDKVRDTSAPKQLQWYVVARRSGNSETLRMPLYLKANPTEPTDQIAASRTETLSGSTVASDGGLQRDILEAFVLAGITYTDVEVQVGEATTKLEGTLNYEEIQESGVPDLDFILYGPDGNELDRSSETGGPEHVSAPVSKAGTYIYRVYGWASGPTNFTITSVQSMAAAPPVLQPFASDFTDAQGRRTDFDGQYTLSWEAQAGALRYEVEESVDGGGYQVIRNLESNTTSVAFQDVPNGTRSYRVRSITPGRVGFYVTVPSNAESITVDRRGLVDITATTTTAISNVSLAGGIFKLDLDMTNGAADTYVPLVEMKIVGINSGSGTVSVANADNGGSGKSASSAALFAYSTLLGSDQLFTPGEKTGVRTIQFRNTAAEMFTFDARVTAYQRGSSQAGAGGGGGDGASSAAGSGSSGSGNVLQSVTKLMRFTVNPLTKTVIVKLL
ncbi:MAG TPA: S8 family serine peptidase [Pyrinomonadaceae bacterium]|nr:S8 family serine peptidase [Pyrinomonadaceae bacterium]